jgi:hypothetical protein
MDGFSTCACGRELTTADENRPIFAAHGVKLAGNWHGFFDAIWHPARSVSELAGPVQFRDFDSETGIGAG